MNESFNGGKMKHLFKVDEETRLYTGEYLSEEAEAALTHGKPFFKIDGSNGMIQRQPKDGDNGDDDDDDSFTLIPCQRLDTKGKPFPESCRPIPDGKNYAVFHNHTYCYKPITLDVPGKKAKKLHATMIQVVKDNTEYLKETFFTNDDTDFVSVEWVGAKFQQTPGVSDEVAMAVHAQQACDDEFERSYAGLKKYLGETVVVEGLVFSHEGFFWKITSRGLNRKCLFETKRDATQPPVILRLKE